MTKLTEKDYQILDFIYEQIKDHGFPPTVREICAAVNLSSPATVHARLNKLEASGIIERDATKNRSMRILNYTPSYASEDGITREEYADVPVYGKITAGVPITAVEQLERYFPIPVSYLHNKDIFMLRVSGESMVNAAILDGDYIIENDYMDPIIVNNVEVLGKVIGVYRMF